MINVKPFGLAPLPHNMDSALEKAFSVLKYGGEAHAPSVPAGYDHELNPDNLYTDSHWAAVRAQGQTPQEWVAANPPSRERGSRKQSTLAPPPPEIEKAWPVFKRWHPEDEGADISATFCEKCGRKLRGGDMDDSICNDCLHNSVPMDSPSLPFEKAWAIFKELNEEDAEDVSPMPTTTKPKSPPVPDLSGPMRLAPDVDPKKVRWEDVYGGPPTKPPVPKPPVEE